MADPEPDTYRSDGKQEVISRTINDEQVKRAEERCRWLKQIIESISGGKLSISYTLAVDSTHYDFAGETRPGWIGDRKIIYENINDFDTLFRKREKDFNTADMYYRKPFLTISPKEAETLKSEFYRDFGM